MSNFKSKESSMIDIQKKQARWLIEKPLFEAEFVFTALLNNVEFNIKTGDFDITQDCPESDRELTHEVVNHSWVMWLRAKSNAVPEGFVLVPTKNVNYFSNDGENYEIHKTLAEAKHEAECAIEHYSDRLADQECDPSSDGSFNQIGYGVILAESSYTVDHVVTQDDIDKGNYSYDVGTEIMSLHLIEAQEPK